MDILASFHPAVRRWFEERFPEGPSAPQRAGWPAIARREHTLIAAPTGSGKTLSAFLVCIDGFYWRAERRAEQRRADFGCAPDEPFRLDPNPPAPPTAATRRSSAPPRGVEVLYVSPLKALAADIQENLARPLAEIAGIARSLGLAVPEIRVALRSGDSTPAERAALVKRPPEILVTTPESLYLLLTSPRGREMLRTVRTVIVDEIHALARDKRGAHLALSLERLEALCDERPTRIGLSATQRPIERIAKLLVGAGPDRVDASGDPRCTIVDVGHRRALDLAVVLPGSELEAVASGEQMGEVLASIAAEVERHRTTLVFVNTRRMAERLAHQLAERLGEEGVAAHHGSLSKERRLRVESALREGRLRALVATASLELGIDVGPVELVCQIGSPRSIATFLQRVGRSGHFLGGLPKGRLYPLTRDELVECAGLLRAVGAGRLDRVHPPMAPLDILAQQIVAACAAEPWKEEELYRCFVGAAPYAELSRETFTEIVELVSNGLATGRGRRAAWVHRDTIGGMLRARRGARLVALTSGGAIPDVADYRVVADPDETFIGTVGEDFAIDSLPGDVFLLGSATWRIRRVEAGKLRVVDAEGASPNIPFWAGEAPARTEELSDEVSALRATLEPMLARGDEAAARAWLAEEAGLGADACEQIARYLAVSRAALGALPTRDRLVLERFFDDAGGMQLVVHSPRGGRLNRALCLALRKKFCRNFNFELQAAANDDAMVLSLGPHHSFPLSDVPHFLATGGLVDTLCQAVLPTPIFTARWRWNLSRALAILRFRGGKKNPPAIQRMEADDLMAAVFPQAAACQENVAGPIEIPDHPLVRQTLHDCLTEALDAAGLAELVARLEAGSLAVHCVDTTEPSPLAHEILNGKPFTFLDDAPLEERRTRAVRMRRGLPVEERDLSRLDADAIARVREQARPAPRDREELHDLLLGTGYWPAEPAWQRLFLELESLGRAFAFRVAEGHDAAEGHACWAAREREAWVAALHPKSYAAASGRVEGCARVGSAAAAAAPEVVAEDGAIAHVLRGQLETTGPIDAAALARRLAVRPGLVEIGLAALEAEGFVLRGRFEARGPAAEDGSGAEPEQFCARRLLSRIHDDSQRRLRAAVEPVSAQDFLRMLFVWQHVAEGSALEGAAGLARIVEQLQGFEVAAGAWEGSVLPLRLRDYQPEWLDLACLSGHVAWLRLAPPSTPRPDPAEPALAAGEGSARAAGTTRSTPLALVLRSDLAWLLQAHRGASDASREGAAPRPPTLRAERILARLDAGGAAFHAELAAFLGEPPVEVEAALWELVASGRVAADGFQALRMLLAARGADARGRADGRARRGLRRGGAMGIASGAEGRWSRIAEPSPVGDRDRLAEALAEQLLARFGIVFRDVVAREHLALPWRDVVWALRRLEARGAIRGGRFVSGFTGEQFALPEALECLERVRRTPRSGERVVICGSDPLNLVGILTPGERVPAQPTREIVFVDGRPESSPEARPDAPLDAPAELGPGGIG
ncbi:MAG: DEAD/DEAH box helicase [Deltaproteobacteria bacterium]|nr:DEAD/DEAH box helicase [Deltaproteobacteria bacterium]